MQKLVNVLAVASSVVSLAVVGLGGYVFINKDSIIQGVTDKAMDSVLGGGFGGAAGGALGGGALPNLSDPDPQQAPPEAPAAGFGLPQ